MITAFGQGSGVFPLLPHVEPPGPDLRHDQYYEGMQLSFDIADAVATGNDAQPVGMEKSCRIENFCGDGPDDGGSRS